MSYFRSKKIDTCLHENAFWFTKSLPACKRIGTVKSSKFTPNSHFAKQVMFIYKITEVKLCMSLRKYHDVTLAENDTTAYIQCLRPHRKVILTNILLKFLQINLKIINIHSENRKINILIKKYPKGHFCLTWLIWRCRSVTHYFQRHCSWPYTFF